MSIFEQMKRGAKRASFEAERVIRIERVQTQIATLNGQLRNGMTQLGYLAYEAMQRGELDHAELLAFRAQLDGLRAQIAQHEAEIETIRDEVFVEATGVVYCGSCGAECAATMQFCARCGKPLPSLAVSSTTAPYAQPIMPSRAASGLACPRCAMTNPPGVSTCARCGQALTAQPVAGVSQPIHQPISQPTNLSMSQPSPRRMLDAGITPASPRQVYGGGG